MSNERLRAALARSALIKSDVAQKLGVDEKTVERWLAGTRSPYPRHRMGIATLVGEDEAYLWPGAVSRERADDASRAELVTLYAHRADVPAALWRGLAERASGQIDLLAYAALHLPEQDPGFISLLRDKCGAGCQVRILLGDPGSGHVAERGAEEGLGPGMAARIEMMIVHYQQLFGCSGLSIQMHDTTLYNSIFRYDDEMLVNAHVWGSKAYQNPVLHLRRVSGGTLFDTYARSFEAVWAKSCPYETS